MTAQSFAHEQVKGYIVGGCGCTCSIMYHVLTFGRRDCLLAVLAGKEGVGGVGMGVAKTVGVAGVGGATVCVHKFAPHNTTCTCTIWNLWCIKCKKF
jgi:hypothetical protein